MTFFSAELVYVFVHFVRLSVTSEEMLQLPINDCSTLKYNYQ